MNPPVSSSSSADNSGAAGATGVGGSADGAKRYRVFLSYSHADTTWARWLMRRLEGYRVPERFHGRAAPIGEVGARIAPVFRDRDELPTADDLGEAVQGALRQSATLVVICSTTAARSRWVNEEVMYFKRIGRADRIFALIVGGEPNATNEAEECFPPGLRFQVGSAGVLKEKPVELIAADARVHGDGKDDAFIRLVAGLLGVGFDELRQREMQRRHRRMFWITASSMAGMAITVGLAVYAMKARNDALVARNDAQRRLEGQEQLMAKFLSVLEMRLKKGDRLDELDGEAEGVMTYFRSLNPRDLTDNANVQQAKALTQIGQMRIKQLKHAQAEEALTGALQRAAAVVQRRPADGEALFERAQAEFWSGELNYRRGDNSRASEWLNRYRDSAVALAALDPKNVKWQLEAVSGYQNLAVMELDRGNLAAARAGFLGARAALGAMAPEAPADRQFQFKLANIDSFLGTTAERSGELAEAITCFGRQIAGLQKIVEAEPETAHWRRRLGDAYSLQGSILAITGRNGEAQSLFRRAEEIFEAVLANDATNSDLRKAMLTLRVRQAQLALAQGDAAATRRLIESSRPRLEQMSTAEKSDRAAVTIVAMCYRIDAQERLGRGDAGAREMAEQALAIGRKLVEQSRANEVQVGELATARVVAGVAAERAGDLAGARRLWQETVDATQEAAQTTRQWRLLDPAARALMLLGRAEEGRAIIAKLIEIGYQPLDPWP